MRADLIVKGRSLTGTSDLTILAPLKQGLVPSLEAVTYKTRTERLLRALSGGRSSSHEFALQRPLSDSVERVGRIHSVRVAVLEPEDKVMLAVTFDGTWESYVRVLWQKVGTLLDVIFYNTEGYVLSTAGFDAWCGWIDRVQIETGFFFSTHALTVGDVDYLRRQELVHCRTSPPSAAALEAVRTCSATAEQTAYAVGQTTTLNAVDTVRQGLQALTQLFRLSDLYLPGTPDGDVLLRAARELLSEFCGLIEDPDVFPEVIVPIHARFARQIAWLNAKDRPAVTTPRAVPALEVPPIPHEDVQGGILAGYDANHACLVLVAFDDAQAAARLLHDLRPLVTPAEPVPQGDGELAGALKDTRSGPFHNVALTFEGLRMLGMTEDELADWLPHEFREGMEARASMLGDFRANHPRRWSLPRLNWHAGAAGAAIEVQLSAVHLVVQIRAHADSMVDAPDDPQYPLRPHIDRLASVDGRPRPGVRVLHVQTMQRMHVVPGRTMEHFGFADGEGQPQFVPARHARYANQVNIGEVLLGYANQADFAPVARTPGDQARLDFLRNGTFMVVRKLKQDVPRLGRIVADAHQRTRLPPRLVLAKMMGRWQGGSSLVDHAVEAPAHVPPDTDFNFDGDSEGRACPFHAHIRRVNPRATPAPRTEPPGARRPRILRRGMAYGRRALAIPGYEELHGPVRPGDERGLVFMAYNASIAEQFEVVQNWVSGGNSTGGYSGHGDPFLGVPEPGQQRYFRFEARRLGRDRPFSIALDRGPDQFEAPEPLVRLEWGAYLFVPSMHTLDWLQARAAAASAWRPTWRAEAGQRTLDDLLARWGQARSPEAIEAWKSAVEDTGAQERLHNASLWAAVRERHGGALRTPYGVLVGTRRLVDEVLGDDERFSVRGQRERMVASGFDIYLGLDRGPRYDALSAKVNQAIGAITKADAFATAAGACEAALRAFMDAERAVGMVTSGTRWELNLDAKEIFDLVLQRLCQQWLGLPERGGPLEPGGWRWDWQEGDAPLYPVHFTPPSRYFFQPRPGEDVRRFGERHGRSLAAALERFVRAHRERGTVPEVPGEGGPAPLARAILEALPPRREDDATVARTFAGVMMGFLPTLDGNLRLVLNEWLRLQRLWSLRAAWAADARPLGLEKAQDLLEPALMQAMQFRPTPELLWRTVQRDADRIGGVALARGDIVVVGLVSALHERLGRPAADVYPAFGGKRSPHEHHPTHACPGYQAAMGVMLGVLAAFVDVRETMRPTPAPLAFTFEGELP